MHFHQIAWKKKNNNMNKLKLKIFKEIHNIKFSIEKLIKSYNYFNSLFTLFTCLLHH